MKCIRQDQASTKRGVLRPIAKAFDFLLKII
uniref:CBFD_NFYB_HMF domain-containing protein n=1 Tax=Heterorhabditis bacteriophora TaxID=37862 RepID=A0A1I7WW31_HETBA